MPAREVSSEQRHQVFPGVDQIAESPVVTPPYRYASAEIWSWLGCIPAGAASALSGAPQTLCGLPGGSASDAQGPGGGARLGTNSIPGEAGDGANVGVNPAPPADDAGGNRRPLPIGCTVDNSGSSTTPAVAEVMELAKAADAVDVVARAAAEAGWVAVTQAAAAAVATAAEAAPAAAPAAAAASVPE